MSTNVQKNNYIIPLLKNISLFLKIFLQCVILFRDLSKIKKDSSTVLKKNSFIFSNFQYVSSTLNNDGYEKARKNYIRSFYKSIKNRNETERIFLAFFFDLLQQSYLRTYIEKGWKSKFERRHGEDRGWRNKNKGQRRLGEKRESAGWSQLHYAYDRWKAIQEAIGRRWRYATAKLTAYLVVRDAIMY